jgi:2-oxoisovalerate dehydrogenase E2 component (dihydrolipoyl transacylase)
MTTFNLPDLGEGLADAEIVSWHVSEGGRVVADQPLVSVETEKAVVEVPAPWSGALKKRHAAPGDVVKVGGPLADIEVEESSEDAGAIVGILPKIAEKPAASAQVSAPASRTKAAPAVRRLATELGVDIATLKGTGPDGAITSKDVEAAGSTKEGYEPLRGVRRAMARNMAQAHAEVAPTTVTEDADITDWLESEDITSRLVRAMTSACKAEPALNAWYDGRRKARRLHARVDLGIAMNTDDGLFVPVLRDAGNRSMEDLRKGLDAMKRDVAARTVPPEELRGQTITLSNFGMIGGRHTALVVMPPQVAILGAGRITEAAKVAGGLFPSHSTTVP